MAFVQLLSLSDTFLGGPHLPYVRGALLLLLLLHYRNRIYLTPWSLRDLAASICASTLLQK